MPKFETKVIWDLNPDFRINPHRDISLICTKMLWSLWKHLTDVSHFTKYGKNWPLIVGEMLTNVQKSVFCNGKEN